MAGSVTETSAVHQDETNPWRASVSPSVLLLSIVAGAASGLFCVSLRFALRFLQWTFTGHSGLMADAAASLPLWRRTATPVLGALAATLILKAARALSGNLKAVDYVEAVRFCGGRMPFVPVAWRTISSCISIASGAAIGREGSMIQFASAAVSEAGQRLRLRSLDKLLTLGTAGAVAAVYQAPVAGAFFSLEIVLGASGWSRIALTQMPSLLIAAGAGSLMSHFFLGYGPIFRATLPVRFSWIDSVPVLLTASAIGLLGPVYFRFLKSANFLRKWPWALIWSGLVVGLFSCLRPETWGNGDSGVLGIVHGQSTLQVVAAILLCRLIATAACAGSGVVGGVFTPTIFTGSALGMFCGVALRLFPFHFSSASGYAIVGIGCLLAAVTHAPFMAAFMTAELTGTPEWLPVLLLSSLLSWQIAKRIDTDSLYAVATPDPVSPAKAE
jgi:chloride channel protein, CIC family